MHPGYGFLSESAGFARAVEEAGIAWVGPPPAAIEQMGDKLSARQRAKRAGVPVVPGTDGSENPTRPSPARRARSVSRSSSSPAPAAEARGWRSSRTPRTWRPLSSSRRRVAEAAFGDGRVYLEKLLERPRHVEFQVFGDRQGNIVHLSERECSVQRRHQKIVEETPSAALDARLRGAMGRAAVEVARGVGYVGAGTVEFLLDERATSTSWR